MMDYLIIQTYCWRPCMEMAGDLALQLNESGHRVGFCFLDVDDPFEPVPFGIRPFQAKKSRKAKQLKRILKTAGVICIEGHHDFDIKDEFYFKTICTTNDLKNITYDEVKLGVGVLSHLITMLADPYPDIQCHRHVVNQGLISSAKAYHLALSLINKWAPKQIIVYNGRTAVSAAIACAAKKSDVVVGYFEASASIHKFNVFEGSFYAIQNLNRLTRELWEEAGPNRIEKAHDFFIRQRTGKQENTNYAKNQVVGNIPVKKSKRFTYFSSSDDELMSLLETDDIGKSTLFCSQREAISFLLHWVSDKADVELVVRVHPHVSKKSENEKNFWNSISGNNVILVDSFSTVDSYALMESSELVLTYGSTAGVEATYWGRASVSMCCAFHSGWGSTYEPRTKAELMQFLETTPLALPQETCLPYGFFAGNNGNYTHCYYKPITSSIDGKFCGKELSMDLGLIHFLKKSKMGRLAKAWRDHFASRNSWGNY